MAGASSCQRLRDLSITVGTLPVGAFNAIPDVAGARVGYRTLIRDTPHVGRTGVTAIWPGTGMLVWRRLAEEGAGSIIVVRATDAPFLALQCHRLACAPTVGLAWVGGVGANGSGAFLFHLFGRQPHPAKR